MNLRGKIFNVGGALKNDVFMHPAISRFLLSVVLLRPVLAGVRRDRGAGLHVNLVAVEAIRAVLAEEMSLPQADSLSFHVGGRQVLFTVLRPLTEAGRPGGSPPGQSWLRVRERRGGEASIIAARMRIRQARRGNGKARRRTVR